MNLLGDSTKLSILTDPFKSDKVTSIHIHFFAFIKSWQASIEFTNGSTEGCQKFTVKGADGLPAIVKQMDEFMKSL